MDLKQRILKQLRQKFDEKDVEKIIGKDTLPAMKVDSHFFLNKPLVDFLINEIEKDDENNPWEEVIMQHLNSATLPGVIEKTIGLPDMHVGYGMSIGHVIAIDAENPESIVSPAGIGYDINCGVRLLRTNLRVQQVKPLIKNICDEIRNIVPTGVGTSGKFSPSEKDIREILAEGQNWAIRKGYAWPEDMEYTEDKGNIPVKNVSDIDKKAKSKGQSQLGTLGCGNHYLEIQTIDKIYDKNIAQKMGIEKEGQVVIMIHTGSRGLGHSIASKHNTIAEEKYQDMWPIQSLKIHSPEGERYLDEMNAAANFAYCNRAVITHQVRTVFSRIFSKNARELDMGLIYDVSHNLAKKEIHMVNGEEKTLLIHRKGATRAFPPNCSEIPEKYREIGQPVLVGGTMGTCSYLLVGTDDSMKKTFGSVCHGAGRLKGRRDAKEIPYQSVLDYMEEKEIYLSTDAPERISEESPSMYKDVEHVIDTCVMSNIAKKICKLNPIGVFKG